MHSASAVFYRSSLAQAVAEQVTDTYPNGAKREAEYWLRGRVVGVRHFHETGEPETEAAFLNGVRHGWQYRWDTPGKLTSAEPFRSGVPHGRAYQWSDDGVLLGTYTLNQGTGVDLWRNPGTDNNGSVVPGLVVLAEVHCLKNGLPHGWEWWLNGYDAGVFIERHWRHGKPHGIERVWNGRDRLDRGYPRFFVRGKRVGRARYANACLADPSLPLLRAEDDKPRRVFPSLVARHLGRGQARPRAVMRPRNSAPTRLQERRSRLPGR